MGPKDPVELVELNEDGVLLLKEHDCGGSVGGEAVGGRLSDVADAFADVVTFLAVDTSVGATDPSILDDGANTREL